MYTVTPLQFMKNCAYVVGLCQWVPEAAPRSKEWGAGAVGLKRPFTFCFLYFGSLQLEKTECSV